MAKVYIDAGHGGYDAGAVKYVTEKTVNLNMALACRNYLEANGVNVKMSRTADNWVSLNGLCREANAWGADLAVSIHNNAGGGDGFEVYHHYGGGRGKTLAANIETEVKKIGQNSRGLKTRRNSSGTDYFGFIRLTNMPAVICEGAFVDNWTDVQIIDTLPEQQAFGYAYARGILKTLGIADHGYNGASSKTTTGGSLYTGAMPSTIIKKGSKGEDVKRWQRFINWYFGKEKPLTVDGIFGDKTETWTKEFQKNYKSLDNDGIVGSQTIATAKAAKK